MKVDVFKLRLVPDNKFIKAIACITIGEVAINDIRIVERSGQFFVNMPSRPDKTGKLHSTAHPTTLALRIEIERVVISAFFDELEKQQQNKLEE